MYYYEKTNGRNHHLPLPDNWEQQVSAKGDKRLHSSVCTFVLVWVRDGEEGGQRMGTLLMFVLEVLKYRGECWANIAGSTFVYMRLVVDQVLHCSEI